MLKKGLIVLLVLIIGLAAFIQMQPNEFSITRSATINAAPADVFVQVNNLKNWNGWSPWAKKDTAMVVGFEGPEAGVGAISTWKGNKEVGEGKMTVTESKENELVRFQVDMVKPFKCNHTAEFTLAPKDSATEVTWTMSGKNNFVSKAMGLFMNMDKMVGADFEAGLAGIKSIVEKK